jgi:hypothetical protein
MTNVLTASKTTGLRDLAITWRPIEALKPYPRNARTHSKKQIREIADSISTFGWTNPVLVDGSGGIIAGHARVEAAKLLGLEKVPTIGIEDLTEAQKRAYILADNKLALNAGWDEVILAEELEGLLATEIDFGIEVTGFSIPEIDSLIDGLVPVEDGDPLEDILPDEGPPVSKRGDIVLDAFGGSGSTLIAAQKTGRRARLIELDPVYVDRIVRRWQAFAHDDAVLAESGEAFDDLAGKRQAPTPTGEVADA